MGITEEKDNKQIRVAIYLRVSTEDQVEKYGLDAQKEAILNYLKAKGKLDDGRDKMILAGEEYIYIDDGISGTIEIDERKGFARLMEDIESSRSGYKPFDQIAVYKIDRLARKLKILLNVIDYFDKNKVGLISINETIDTSTAFGKAILGIMGVIAELEIETTKMRTQAGRLQALKQGKVSVPSYGYIKNTDKRMIIFEDEAKVVRQIFHMCVFEDKGSKEIADWLKDHKIESPEVSAHRNKKHKGKMKKINDIYFWKNETIRELLSDEVYIGNFYYYKTQKGKVLPREEWKLAEYHHQPVIENLIFDKAQEKLRASASKVALNRKRKEDSLYLLAGLLKCGYCSNGLVESNFHTWNGDKKELKKGSGVYSYYYKCGHKNIRKYSSTCPTIPIPAEQLEEYIIAFVKKLLSNPKAAYEYQLNLKSTTKEIKFLKFDREKLAKNFRDLPKRRKNILTQHEHGYVDDIEVESKMKELLSSEKNIRKKLEEIDSALGKQQLSEGYVKSFNIYARKYDKALDDVFNNKKEVYRLLHNLIDRIIIYTRPFNPRFDVIAGRRKDNQQVPNNIIIKLKLPQNLIEELITQTVNDMEFGVKTSTL